MSQTSDLEINMIDELKEIMMEKLKHIENAFELTELFTSMTRKLNRRRYIVEEDGIVKYYDTLRKIADEYHVSIATISYHISGKHINCPLLRNVTIEKAIF